MYRRDHLTVATPSEERGVIQTTAGTVHVGGCMECEHCVYCKVVHTCKHNYHMKKDEVSY